MIQDTFIQLPENLLFLWHLHRTEILVLSGILLTIGQVVLRWRTWNHERRSNSGESHDVKEKLDHSTDPTFLLKSLPSSNTETLTRQPRRIQGSKPSIRPRTSVPTTTIQPIIYYFTLGGSTRSHAEHLRSSLSAASSSPSQVLTPIIHDLTTLDYEDHFTSPPRDLPSGVRAFYILLLPSYDIDTELSNFLSHLDETHNDFRVDTAPLSALAGFSVFGFGDSEGWVSEAEGFCWQAVEADKWMARLTGGKRGFPLGTGEGKNPTVSLEEWASGVRGVMLDLARGGGLGEGVPGSGDAVESGDEEEEMDRRQKKKRNKVEGDLEDIKPPIPVDFTTTSANSSAPKAMVPTTSPTYASLTKQGYTIVGTHSGVKICRWTKSALRGRGSCYKFSFYGIASHRCMEATPSLSCSNKCVFCWRHGTNPVGTTWRWQVDPPQEIFDGIKAGHYKKIKMLRGIPGVRGERFAEAMRIGHCALSLVGEPIFYPHINELLAMLHREHISSFLVCNAQHPDQLAALGPVTQLYVSIDAADKASLRAIDRPLHRDFWERFLRCMDILRQRRDSHRTVFRLTLVKDFNAAPETISGYADLVARALPSFVEVKGVTYCGTSTAAGAGLTMANVPFYEEVQTFVLSLKAELASRGLHYGIGAEHAHSCCILLADTERYYRPTGPNGEKRWHTLIDYPKFFECVESGKPFGPGDYVSETPTPDWALWGNGGFDPRDQRVDRKGRPKVVANAGG